MSHEIKQPTLRVALIGCGQHMSEVLMPMLRLQPFVQVAAVASRSKVTAEAFAHRWQISKVLANWRETFDSSFDGVICSGPVQLHEEVSLACAKNNVPLFVEKPLARRLEAVQEINENLGSKRVPLQVGYNLRFSDTMSALKAECEAQSVDRIEINYHTNKPRTILWSLDSIDESLLVNV